jgi:hypothetical protein
MAGSHCSLGNCVDDCAGAKCPTGQICSMGGCVVDPNAQVGSGGSGGGGGSGGDIIIVPNPNPASGGTTGSPGTGNGAGTKGSGDDNGETPMLSSGEPAGSSGCGCSVPSGRGGFVSLVSIAGLLLGALGLRRRRS